jgi:TonB family protein
MQTANIIGGMTPSRRGAMRLAGQILFLAALALPGGGRALASPGPEKPSGGEKGGRRELVSEKTGSFAIRDGQRVRVSLDMGDVHVSTDASGEVRFHLRVEAAPGQYDAEKARKLFVVSARNTSEGGSIVGALQGDTSSGNLWVSIEVVVPKATPLEVVTQGGNIDVQDLDGKLRLSTAGGNITTGRLGAGAHIVTQGGHITVQDVTGDLDASTGGGQITTGRVRGEATLRTGGGHIRVAAVDGAARLDTGGGNIFLQKAGTKLTVSTGGGRIVIGESTSGMMARTGSGGIRVLEVSGRTDIETGSGPIFVSRVRGSLRASTGSGAITAWFVAPQVPAPGGRTAGSKNPPPRSGEEQSQLISGNGDIVVYLPRQLAISIDATVENTSGFRIDADPLIALKVRGGEDTGEPMRAEGSLNGGGALLRLRAADGNIRLRLTDSPEAPQALLEPQFFNDLEKSLAEMKLKLEAQSRFLERTLDEQLRNLERLNIHPGWEHERRPPRPPKNAPELLSEELPAPPKPEIAAPDQVVLSADELSAKLVERVPPVYPEAARKRHMEGTVRLRIAVAPDGSVADVRVLSGHSVLTQAAIDAVRRWRYAPTLVDGRPVTVISRVAVEFWAP